MSSKDKAINMIFKVRRKIETQNHPMPLTGQYGLLYPI